MGLSNECEKALKAFESTLVAELGHGLGRYEESKFSRFKSSTESAGARYVRTTCVYWDQGGMKEMAVTWIGMPFVRKKLS